MVQLYPDYAPRLAPEQPDLVGLTVPRCLKASACNISSGYSTL